MTTGTKAGTYPVFLKVSYRDNLRIPHELTINGSVDYEPIQQTNNEGQSIFGIGSSSSNVARNTPAIIPILVILVISIIIVTIVVLRKRRSKSKLSRILGISNNNNINKEEREEDIGSLSDGPTDRKSDGIIDEKKKG